MNKKNKKYLLRIRKSRIQRDDVIGTDLGYNYRKNGLIKNYISNYLFTNPNLNDFLQVLDSILIFIIDEIKEIKKVFNIAVDKYSKDLN